MLSTRDYRRIVSEYQVKNYERTTLLDKRFEEPIKVLFVLITLVVKGFCCKSEQGNNKK